MEEGTVAKWFKKVGDQVSEGDILAEIETDKATMEFESFNEGELLHIGIQEGGTAPVDTLLAIIGDKGEDISALLSGGDAHHIRTRRRKRCCSLCRYWGIFRNCCDAWKEQRSSLCPD